MNKVLLIEDSREIYTQVNQAISPVCELTWNSSLKEGKETLKKGQWDLLILDIELPDGNGIEFCSEVSSQNPKLPIFMLTSHTSLSEKVLGFSAGAEDYITKPFQTLEFKARVESKLKKMNTIEKLSSISKWNKIEIDKNKQKVKILENRNFIDIDLTHLEFRLLTYLSDRAENVIPREELLNEIWGQDVYVYPRSVDTHVSKLRKKLGSVSEYIKSVHGSGYKFSEID